METLTGYLVDLTEEKQGPVKLYKRFTIITTATEHVSAWIFSSIPFEQTSVGNILLEAVNKQTAVTIKGKINSESGGKRTMKIFLTHKYDQPIRISNTNDKLPTNAIVNVSIRDALMSEGLSRISVKVIDENPIIHYQQDDKEHKYKTCIVADDSASSVLMIYDQLIDAVKPETNYIFTNIKPKKIYDTSILSSTSNTTVSGLTKEVLVNVDDLNETMAINLTDMMTICTTIQEIGDIKEENSCSICRQNMTPIPSKPNLIKCGNCKKTMVKNKQNIQINITIEIADGVKMMFWTAKGLLINFIKQQGLTEDTNPEDISEILLLHGPWNMTLSIFRRQLLTINKE